MKRMPFPWKEDFFPRHELRQYLKQGQGRMPMSMDLRCLPCGTMRVFVALNHVPLVPSPKKRFSALLLQKSFGGKIQGVPLPLSLAAIQNPPERGVRWTLQGKDAGDFVSYLLTDYQIKTFPANFVIQLYLFYTYMTDYTYRKRHTWDKIERARLDDLLEVFQDAKQASLAKNARVLQIPEVLRLSHRPYHVPPWLRTAAGQLGKSSRFRSPLARAWWILADNLRYIESRSAGGTLLTSFAADPIINSNQDERNPNREFSMSNQTSTIDRPIAAGRPPSNPDEMVLTGYNITARQKGLIRQASQELAIPQSGIIRDAIDLWFRYKYERLLALQQERQEVLNAPLHDFDPAVEFADSSP